VRALVEWKKDLHANGTFGKFVHSQDHTSAKGWKQGLDYEIVFSVVMELTGRPFVIKNHLFDPLRKTNSTLKTRVVDLIPEFPELANTSWLTSASERFAPF
jgi:hypothetical protein